MLKVVLVLAAALVIVGLILILNPKLNQGLTGPNPINTNSSVSTPTPSPTSGMVSKVKIFMIGLEDQGKSGQKIGCDDSVVAVEREITPTQAPLGAALTQLLSLKSKDYGQSGLYNALYQSDLKLDNVTIASGVAQITLSGKLSSGGVCDDPRIKAQFESTALQFPTVKEAKITINGQDLNTLLSGSGK
ncbi:GerMN domain-containing protein [Candidatus Daviesbacteria bacterium]|nr:GerMN domain-containing protein [Candidatus Daviesbacteria bacterium]